MWIRPSAGSSTNTSKYTKALENLQVLTSGVSESKLLGELKRFRGILKYLQFEKSGLIFISRVEGEQGGGD